MKLKHTASPINAADRLDLAPSQLLSGVAPWLAGIMFALVAASPARAQTWLANPVDNNYNNSANWTPAAPVNNGTATAGFGSSSVTSIGFSSFFDAGSWTFNPGASNYQFSLGATSRFSGAGIAVNGGSVSIATN